MTHHLITSHITGQILYQGQFSSFRDCLEQAVLDNASLDNADLKNLNLTGINLDDGLFRGADFSGSNLAGANLSEADLQYTTFTNTDLFNTCFAYSDMQHADFSGASFGATDITGADISHALFSTLSCFSLDFSSVSSMLRCRYKNNAGGNIYISRPPVVVRGIGAKTIVFTETSWLHGTQIFPYPEQLSLLSYLTRDHTTSGKETDKPNKTKS